jgi:hypothetical protein
VPCIERGPGEGPGRLVGLYQFLKEDRPRMPAEVTRKAQNKGISLSGYSGRAGALPCFLRVGERCRRNRVFDSASPRPVCDFRERAGASRTVSRGESSAAQTTPTAGEPFSLLLWAATGPYPTPLGLRSTSPLPLAVAAERGSSTY